MKLKALITDDDAVSPVIGVILMVAITVILAAVIGTFVLGLGENLSDPAPQSSLSMSDSGENYQPDDTTLQSVATISHNGGDALKAEDLKIVIKSNSGSSLASMELDSGAGTFASSTTAGETLHATSDTSGTVLSSSDELQVGDSWYIRQKSEDDAGDGGILSSGSTYTIQVIHMPSQKSVVTTEVTIN